MGKRIDITGMRFGRLTPEYCVGQGRDKRAMWKCKCECGNSIIVSGKALRNGNTKSCGCLNRDKSTERIVSFNTRHGQANTRLYRIWGLMKLRCNNPNTINYNDYGGRGIKVCDEWANDFEVFYEWAMAHGYDDALTIDRIDFNGNYSPDNCRWATNKQQQNNRRSNKVVSFDDKQMTISEWSDALGMNYDALEKRLLNGWSAERALTTPIRKKRKP